METVRTVFVKNGEADVPYTIYKCERCGCDVEESHPRIHTDDGVYCWSCAFIDGLITEDSFLKFCGIYLSGMRAAVHEEKIYLESFNRKFPWEKDKKRQRHDPQYIRWRTSVFERDNFTCQICGQVGGTLNAHHIKPFATNENLRFDVDNGVTLCEKCHKRVHKEKDEKWIK